MPRLSFSLRDVFWLTLVVGVVLAMWGGWSLDRQSQLKCAREYGRLHSTLMGLEILMVQDGWSFNKEEFNRGGWLNVSKNKDAYILSQFGPVDAP